jgi:hypothetical protein
MIYFPVIQTQNSFISEYLMATPLLTSLKEKDSSEVSHYTVVCITVQVLYLQGSYVPTVQDSIVSYIVQVQVRNILYVQDSPGT